MIEKHFTLDKNMPGPDHKASLEPDELGRMVKNIRNIEIALGDGVKRVSESEKKKYSNREKEYSGTEKYSGRRNFNRGKFGC